MRPIEKALYARFVPYTRAKRPLITNVGNFCSYCETSRSGLEVEHVIPHTRGGSEFHSKNFVLACKSCNGVKSKKNKNRVPYIWPDQDNTFKAFKYSIANVIEPHPNLSKPQKILAQNTIDLMGLNRRPNNLNLPQPTIDDARWLSRQRAWDIADKYLQKFRAGNTDIENICDLAFAEGHFSIWMETFRNETAIRNALIVKFVGTDVNCFDAISRCRSKGKI